MMRISIGSVIADHKNTGYKEIYTGVEYFKVYAMNRNHDFKHDFIITDTPYTFENKELSPLRMLSLIKQALCKYIYVAFSRDNFFEDFWYERPFENKSISINAKVLFLLPYTRQDLCNIGVEGVFHFYTNMTHNDDTYNFVSNKWRKTPEIERLYCVVNSLEIDKWNDGELELLKEM